LGAFVENISIKHRLIALLATALLGATAGAPSQAQDVIDQGGIRGAGSTFAHPIIARWSEQYRKWRANDAPFPVSNSGLEDPIATSAFDYEPIGSLAGLLRVRVGAVDFAASDAPLSSEELTKLGLAQFPIVIGGVAIVYNIDGVAPGELKLTSNVLADIYLGTIQNWNDPAIAAINPGVKLPDAKIVAVRRADGSGTTYNLAHFLAATHPEWKDRLGVDTTLSWPTQTVGVRRTEGVATSVRQTRNSIGYVEYGFAVKQKLSYAQIQNSAGQFVRPDVKSFQAAAASADWKNAKDFNLMLTGAPGNDAYPIVATVFALMPKTPAAPRRSREVLNYLQWSLERGAKDAEELGLVPLPESLVLQVKEYWQSTLKAGS
jgi:phosphate transport system substrate-binding protein